MEWNSRQAVLSLCMAFNLNLLCKDGYIISFALFVGDRECLLSLSKQVFEFRPPWRSLDIIVPILIQFLVLPEFPKPQNPA